MCAGLPGRSVEVIVIALIFIGVIGVLLLCADGFGATFGVVSVALLLEFKGTLVVVGIGVGVVHKVKGNRSTAERDDHRALWNGYRPTDKNALSYHRYYGCPKEQRNGNQFFRSVLDRLRYRLSNSIPLLVWGASTVAQRRGQDTRAILLAMSFRSYLAYLIPSFGEPPAIVRVAQLRRLMHASNSGLSRRPLHADCLCGIGKLAGHYAGRDATASLFNVLAVSCKSRTALCTNTALRILCNSEPL